MKMEKTKILDCYEIYFDSLDDDRGNFIKIFNDKAFKDFNLNQFWKEDYITTSKKNVIRGMHFQSPPYDHHKIVACLSGEVLDVVVDLRKKSKTFLNCISFNLSSDRNNGVYIPKGCAHGFLSLKENSKLLYKVSSIYNPKVDNGILWSSINFNWPIDNPIISKRDRKHPEIQNYKTEF